MDSYASPSTGGTPAAHSQGERGPWAQPFRGGYALRGKAGPLFNSPDVALGTPVVFPQGLDPLSHSTQAGCGLGPV